MAMSPLQLLLIALLTIIAAVNGQIACEGYLNFRIPCHPDNDLQITKALWTRQETGNYCTTCCNKDDSTYHYMDKYASGVEATGVYRTCSNSYDFSKQLTDYCKSRRPHGYCEFNVKNEFFQQNNFMQTDNCNGIYKYLTVSYSCIQ